VLQKNISFGFYIIILFLALFNFSYYLNQYFVQQNYFNAPDWQYGYAQTIAEVQKQNILYRNIVVSSKAPLDQSYIFFLFYLKYPPQKYQKESLHKPANADQAFGNFIFRPLDWKNELKTKDILYIGSPRDFESDYTVQKTIYYPDEKPAMMLVRGKK